MAQLVLDVQKIREYMAHRQLSERDLAQRMEVAYSYLNRVLAGKRNAGARAIAGFLLVGFTWDEIFQVIPDDAL